MGENLAAFVLAGLSGLFLALIGIAFRIGQSKNVVPLHIATSIGIFGAIFFGIKMDWSNLLHLPFFIYGVALLNALGQVLSMELTKISLRKGPLSPVWCALNLNFLIVIIYSAVVFSEKISGFQYLALVSGVLCVIVASNLGHDPASGERGMTLKNKLIYSLMLLLILLGNSIVFITIKDLGTRFIPGETVSYLGKYMPGIYFVLYITMAVICGGAALLRREKPDQIKDLFKLGGLAGVGSIGGLFLLSLCAKYPAALVFTVNGMVTILGGTLASVFFFGERRTRFWYATITLGVLAVLLTNLDKLI